MTAMRKIHLLLPLILLGPFGIAANKTAAREFAEPPQSSPKLQSVELEEMYSIKIPEDYTTRRVSDRGEAPLYFLEAPQPPYRVPIEVLVLPYKGVWPTDKETGVIALPVRPNNSPPLTNYFKLGEDWYIYYGWSTTDEAYECTMNSPCPHATNPRTRYITEYAFVLFDKPNGSIVEFLGVYFGPDKNVTTFKGDGKLLREVIVPSLSAMSNAR